MAIIKTVDVNEAEGKVAEVYGILRQSWGFVPNALKLYSSSPALMERQFQTIGYYMSHPTLKPHLLMFIRMLVSVGEECEYCVGMNAGMLMRAGFTLEQIKAAQADPNAAPLDEKEKKMLLFVLKVVKEPKSVTVKDLDELRALGYTDGDILDAAAHGTNQIAGDAMFNAFQIDRDF